MKACRTVHLNYRKVCPWNAARIFLSFSLALLLFSPAILWAQDMNILHHDLTVTIHPEHHELMAEDTLKLKRGTHDPSIPIRLLLNPTLIVKEVRIDDRRVPFKEPEQESHSTTQGSHTQDHLSRMIEINQPPSSNQRTQMMVTIVYQGTINDPPRRSPGLRFVRPDTTMGHIGPQGVYLSSETHWYPDVPGRSLATFTVHATVPKQWEVVTQGREMSRRSLPDRLTTEWQVYAKSEALTLVANHFVKQQRDWNGINLATYLFPEDAHLAETYLTATARYLTMYQQLLGRYPFPKFAVVENFFPSGLGLPSFTLLGNRVIKRRYIQPYALGHELVHSWFGNAVFNDFSKGNWVEGLTTYLSNYYYEERHRSPKDTAAQRRRMMMEYSLYTRPETDYALRQFHHKETQQDNAIGYQKAAMVFHMLRRELGDQFFFRGIRFLAATQKGRYVDWNDLEDIFERTSRQSLQWFFEQWVDRPGAPLIQIKNFQVQRDAQGPTQFLVRVHIAQQGRPYRLSLPASLMVDESSIFHTTLKLEKAEQTFTIPL